MSKKIINNPDTPNESYEYRSDPYLSTGIYDEFTKTNKLNIFCATPLIAVNLNYSHPDYGYLYKQGPDKSWYKDQKLTPIEIEQAQDQVADMQVQYKFSPSDKKKSWF